MAKIPFDIKYRPQIESGEYKLETECGHPVSIMDWEWIDRDEKKCLAVKVLMDEGFNIGYLFDYDGKRHSIFPSDSDSDLFLVTPEPELSEFEKACMKLYNEGCDDGLSGDKLSNESLKESASELLELARKELENEAPSIIHAQSFNAGLKQGKAEAVEKYKQSWFNEGKIDGRFEGLTEDEKYQQGVHDGKEEALKDLPKWRYKKGGTGPILHDCIVLNKYGCIGKSPSGALLGDVWTLEYDELAKLPKEKPGFKED